MTVLSNTPAKLLKEQFNLINFVETGCDTGDALVYADILGFKRSNIYSCDIRQEAVSLALSKVPGITVYTKDSIEFLKLILPSLVGNTLFWLDAHYPSHYGAEETAHTKMPIIEEILLIKQLKKDYYKDVILCDDMRVFVSNKNRRYVPREIPDYYYIYNRWDEFISTLSDTHNFRQENQVEGIGIFFPK